MKTNKGVGRFFIAFFMLASLFSPSAAANSITTSQSFTHTVFAEFGTATSCYYCKYARAALENIYAGGLYPFYYATFVEDKNVHAAERMRTDYNILALPTVYFDGGYQFELGASSSWEAEAEYIASIDTCGVRSVPDIEATLFVAWSGDAKMYIQVSVQNNDTNIYEGHIRVYVTEIVSSRGWNDTHGSPYAFTFLDYAFDEDILINPGYVWEQSTMWNGSEHTDGHGGNFGDITQENVMIIAAVFNAEGYLKYNNPPWAHPFTAYNMDEVTSGLWINFPPFTPGDPAPEDEAAGVELEANLSWSSAGDPNLGDTVRYDVYFGTNNPPPLVVSHQSASTYDPGIMLYYTTYYWKVTAWDNHDTSTAGPVWSFTTKTEWTCGDCNRDEEINVSDVVYLVNYLFKQGAAPDPIEVAEVNCDGDVTVSDVIYLINYLYKGGAAPGC